MWLVGLCSAFGIKLSSSIDDVVWLAPFLTSNSSRSIILQNSLIYTSVCACQTVVAMAIAYGGRRAVEALTGGNKDAWSPEKILTVGAGCMLTLYSFKLTHEYIQENCGAAEEENGAMNESPEQGTYNKVATNEGEATQYESGRAKGCCGPGGPMDGGEMELAKPQSAREMMPNMPIDAPNAEQEALEKADKERQQTLFVIAFIGSVDDLTLFVPMLVGKGFDLPQLMIGALAAATTIVIICVCIGQCKPIADCLSAVPLAAIVIVFAIVLLLKGFVFDEEADKVGGHHHKS